VCCSMAAASSGGRSRLQLLLCFRSLLLLSSSLLTQHPGRSACSWLVSALWEKGLFPAELQLDIGERKKVRACSSFWKKCPFISPCCIYTPLKYKGVILSWFLFPFSPRIGRSNSNFCYVLHCRCQFRNRQKKLRHCRFRNQ